MVTSKKKRELLRGMVFFPNKHITKNISVAVFTSPIKTDQCKLADRVGVEDLIAEIKSKKIDYDFYLASPDMLSTISQIASVLGPRGLFPSAKNNTMTDDLENMIKSLKKGVLQYKEDRSHIINGKIGHVSMSNDELLENLLHLVKEIIKSSNSLKITDIIKSVYINSTMGPSFHISLKSLI
jgi:large subunit ribosomal protein L1